MELFQALVDIAGDISPCTHHAGVVVLALRRVQPLPVQLLGGGAGLPAALPSLEVAVELHVRLGVGGGGARLALHSGHRSLTIVTVQHTPHLQPGVRLTSSMAMSPCCPSATVASTWAGVYRCGQCGCYLLRMRHQQPELPAVVGGGQLHVQLLPDVVVLAVGGPRAEQVVAGVAQAGSSYIIRYL